MNIEDERKAFEAVCEQKGISTVRANAPMMFSNGKRMGVGDYFEPAYTAFEFWIQAKQHAVEMTKPKCRIVNMVDGSFWVYDSFDERLGTGDTKANCLEWATANGYRVIEE